LSLVKKVADKYKLPATSDIHAHEEAAIAAKYVDILQIPAFLCRQTDLLIAAAQRENSECKEGTILKWSCYEVCR